MAVFERIWGFIRQLLGLILPVFSKARDLPGLGAGIRWTLRIIFFAALIVILKLLNTHFEMDSITPDLLRPLADWYLPILGTIVIALCWLAWWLWRLWGPDEEVSAFPDIDEAWEEAIQALNQAGTAITDVPLFLVLGKPIEAEEGLFAAADLRPTVRQAPTRTNSPLHVYGFRDGKNDSVFLTCAGASLLGRQASILGNSEAMPLGGGGEIGGALTEDDLIKTLKPEGDAKEIVNIIAQAGREGRGIHQLTAEERRHLRSLDRKARPSLLKNEQEVGLATARLKHLCRLISRERRPYCPINGIVVLIPIAATDSDDDAQQTAGICQHDLTAAREVLQLQCPVIALLCDMETSSGFREFVDRFPKDKLRQRMGQRFPLVPDLERGTLHPKLESAAGWICNSLFPTWVYKFFKVETGAQTAAESVTGNAPLVKLLCQMRDRHKRLGQILTKGMAPEREDPPLFGGCYVAATGRDAREQAFVAGFFRRVIENQNFVSWTPDALRDDKRSASTAFYGFITIGVLALVLIGAAVKVIASSGK